MVETKWFAVDLMVDLTGSSTVTVARSEATSYAVP